MVNVSGSLNPRDRRTVEYLFFQKAWSIEEIAQRIGNDQRNVARHIESLDPARFDDEAEIGAPIAYGDLEPRAREALEDFGAFRRIYLGRSTSPWAEYAAKRVLELLESPEREYVVINAPPAIGKSTMFVHDLPAWLTARDRTIRGLIGSSNMVLATPYCRRLRTTLARDVPMQGNLRDVEAGQAFDAETTLSADYGRFRPVRPDAVWRASEFVVEQLGETMSEEKEATWTAYGQGEQLGTRVNFAVWDDLVTTKNSSSETTVALQKEFFEREAEQRIDPGGLFIIQGQRIRADDLYRWAIDRVEIIEDEDGFVVESRPVYHHIKFPAHFDDECQGIHSPAEALPAGDFNADGKPTNGHCLLDPYRQPYRGLMTRKRTNPNVYATVFQQEDLASGETLVPAFVLEGGIDPDGERSYVGCLDLRREICQLPEGLTGLKLSVATVDPSPSKLWAIQWWIYHPETHQRFLMDVISTEMRANELLDYNPETAAFTGCMERWQDRSVELGLPIANWILETNVAQKFMLQYAFVRKWKDDRRVSILPHTTQVNKNDSERGVWSLAGLYKQGLIRIPWNDDPDTRAAIRPFINEITRYPKARNDDQVMAQWFLEYNIEKLTHIDVSELPQLSQSMPGFLVSSKKQALPWRPKNVPAALSR